MILPVLPLILPLIAAIVLMATLGNAKAQKWISTVAAFSMLASSIYLFFYVYRLGIVAFQLGGWEAPFGISIVLDRLSMIMLTATACVAVSVILYACGSLDKRREKSGFYPLVFCLLTGVNGAFITGDIFNLYVWYEVMLTASFVLITLGKEKDQLSAGIKYLTINFVASIFFVSAIGILYGMVGSLNMADIAKRLMDAGEVPYISGVCMLFFIAFSIKAALFPFFFWLPASYHTPPIVITALFSGTLTKVAIYTLIRFQSLYFFSETAFWKPFFLVTAFLTMIVGVLMAASQYDTRKILSFHIISQVGYMVMGMAISTIGSLAGAIYFVAHNIFSKTSLFFVAGLVNQRSHSYEIRDLGGLYSAAPALAVLFSIPALALAGIPPLPGFFGKFLLVRSSLEEGDYLIAAAAILVSLATLFSMAKIWNEVYWKKKTYHAESGKISRRAVAATSFLMACVVLMGVFAGPLIALCQAAAEQILDPQQYIQAVMERG